MAKVNQGSLYFEFNDDMQGLTRQILRLSNSSTYVAEKKLGEIFDKNGKNRVNYYTLEGKTTSEFISDEPTMQSAMLANIDSEWMFNYIMKTLSTYPKLKMKSAIIIFFMTLGFHFDFKDQFKLRTDLVNSDIDDGDMDTINKDNKFINDIINSYMADATARADSISGRMIDDVRTEVNDLAAERLIKMGSNVFTESTSSHIFQTISQSIDLTDTEYESLSRIVNGARAEMNNYFKPQVKDLVEVFGLSLSTYKRLKNDGLNILIHSCGYNLVRKVVDNG